MQGASHSSFFAMAHVYPYNNRVFAHRSRPWLLQPKDSCYWHGNVLERVLRF